MTLDTHVNFSKDQTTISIPSLDTIIQLIDLNTLPKKIDNKSLYLLFNEKELVTICHPKKMATLKQMPITQLIIITPPTETELIYLERILINKAIENKIPLSEEKEYSIPQNFQNQLEELVTSLLLILTKMGYPFKPTEAKKTKPGKARHKWTKKVSEKEFFIDTRDSKATVMWIKRNQMLIKKGATMMTIAPLNKDGSVGFSAKMGDKLRSENQDKFEHFVTTEDIILKSVNEVGLFLYFAGTNSWLEMIDQEGKTLNEWTMIE